MCNCNNKIFILLYIASVIINLVIWFIGYKDDDTDNTSGKYLICSFLPFFNIIMVILHIVGLIYLIGAMIWYVLIIKKYTLKQLMEKEFK